MRYYLLWHRITISLPAIFVNNRTTMIKTLLLFAFVLLACTLPSILADCPLALLESGPAASNHEIRFGQPHVIPEPDADTLICLFVQGDANFRILRVDSQEDCENNIGDLLYHSGFSLLTSNETYYTRLQQDGNIVTRKTGSNQWVWKTDSSQGEVVESFWLVLNCNDSVSIVNEDGTDIWNSNRDTPEVFNRPLTLMKSFATTGPPRHASFASRVWYVRPIQIRDRLMNTWICLVQQGDGNFRVVRGDDCRNNQGDLVYNTGLVYPLPHNGEKYWTMLQRDGNLVTRREVSKKWAWKSCSGQGPDVHQVFELVLTANDTLAIVDMNGVSHLGIESG